MPESKCNLCGAALLADTSFCRQCGSAITLSNAEGRSEAPTALFNHPVDSARTQRLDPRTTSPEPGLPRMAGTAPVALSSAGRRKIVVLGFVLVLVVVGMLTTVVVLRMFNANPTSDSGSLIYPGAQTTVDMANTDGSRTIQLQTKEPLAQVESWYQTNVKLSKIVRLTSQSVVMKEDKLTITLAEEDGTTNILIKQAP